MKRLTLKDYYTYLSKYKKGRASTFDIFHANDPYIEQLEARVKELEDILKDFITTKECQRTWVDEMQATIHDVLGEGVLRNSNDFPHAWDNNHLIKNHDLKCIPCNTLEHIKKELNET